MMTEEQKPSNEARAEWPSVVFVDTNPLYALGAQFENVDFTELLDIRKYLRFDLLVPEVCWREFLRQRRIEVDESLQKFRKIKAHFGKGTCPRFS